MKFPDDFINKIHLETQGNFEIVKQLPDNCIDAVVTDPPYGLSFMGKKWDYDVPSVKCWKEVLRVLKPGGHLLSFGGSRTYHRMACAIEDAGFEIRDQIMWVYGSGFPKSLNIGKAVDKLQGNEREVVGETRIGKTSLGDATGWDTSENMKAIKESGKVSITKGTSAWEGYGTALKPAHEPIVLARKPLSEKTVAENCLKWGVGGLAIDECRVGTDSITTNEKGKQNGNTPIVPQSPDFVGETHTGRFPSNFIHDGSQEVVELFPNTKSQVRVSEDKDTPANTFSLGRTGTTPRGHNDSGSAARFFYCAKASNRERDMGCEGLELKQTTGGGNVKSPSRNNHPTVKPIALMEYLVKLISREGQIVLDCFMGSGSTALACKNLNRNFIGMDIYQEYIDISNARLKAPKEKTKIKKVKEPPKPKIDDNQLTLF
jgi:DNA modification methylase